MQVVPATVHDAGGDGREVEPGILVDRQAVDVGAQRDGRACVRTGDLRHDTGLHRVREHVDAAVAQHTLQIGARLRLVERTLGVRMQMAADRDQFIGERDARGEGFHHGSFR